MLCRDISGMKMLVLMSDDKWRMKLLRRLRVPGISDLLRPRTSLTNILPHCCFDTIAREACYLTAALNAANMLNNSLTNKYYLHV